MTPSTTGNAMATRTRENVRLEIALPCAGENSQLNRPSPSAQKGGPSAMNRSHCSFERGTSGQIRSRRMPAKRSQRTARDRSNRGNCLLFFWLICGRIPRVEGIVHQVAIPVVVLHPSAELNSRISLHEAADTGVVNSPVHVYESHVVETLVPSRASAPRIRRRAGGSRAIWGSRTRGSDGRSTG